MANPTAPAGGFQNGGWYEGRQYWNGTFSDPGVINAQSNQQGAGQAVSSEVNKQSDKAQGLAPGTIDAYLAGQRQQQTNSSTGGVPMPGGGTDWTMAGATGQSGGGVPAPSPAQPIDLNGIYSKLQEESGVAAKQAELDALTRGYTEAKGKSNDNPFLSEATRVGREAKLTKLYDERTLNTRNEIAQKKADIETKLQLQLKQFDINSQQAKTNLDQFTSLLSMGALNNASGEDIANLTRSTGLSSGVIQSAIQNKKLSNLQTTMQAFDDGVNEGFAIFTIDPYGNVVNQTKQVTGKSTKATAKTQYSSDPAVSQFLSSLMGGSSTGSSTTSTKGSTTSIQSLW
jgi:hypothetical protein